MPAPRERWVQMNRTLIPFALLAIATNLIAADAKSETIKEYLSRRRTEIEASPLKTRVDTSSLMKRLLAAKQSRKQTGCQVLEVTEYASPKEAKTECVDGYCGKVSQFQIVSKKPGSVNAASLIMRHVQMNALAEGKTFSVTYRISAQQPVPSGVLPAIGDAILGHFFTESRFLFEFVDDALVYVGHTLRSDKTTNWADPNPVEEFECGKSLK
jgi:hypothetical protein